MPRALEVHVVLDNLSAHEAAESASSGLVAGYGQEDILRGVDLEVESGTITCVIALRDCTSGS